jgi:nickel transport protein
VRQFARLLCVALLLLALPATSASAHKLKVFAFAEGETIRGLVYFSGNGPAQGTRIQVFDPDGVLLAEATTDREGHFTIIAARRVDHRIGADSGDGHHAEYVVRADELSPALPAIIGSSAAELETMIERAVARQVGPLREQLDAFEDRVRWHDVLGGLGYILGITGIACYLIARRNRQP